ncbi:putative Small nuclear ribonucleoprotein Sm D3 [Glarea lozoyensis 74030]|uniref:Putative Small nuclear ribonucleoprotein Sm D3 n=1 Tax=Glarea lozoyensis (strain ATCC 74030 / MF5533) TaxID=1104152 RepID=H0EM45_GLAL7|nr:putative Small nuclear ribonucleoprotein Sm D3 [Glarea lozoyensis 74030]
MTSTIGIPIKLLNEAQVYRGKLLEAEDNMNVQLKDITVTARDGRQTKVPIWLDEISEPEVWAKEFLAPEAREVLSVLGGFVVCFRKPTTEKELEEIKELLKHVQEVVKEGCGYSWDGVCLAVGMKQSITPFLDISHEDWEDTCQDHGFEFIDFELAGKNEYKESQGVGRLREALEANDWNTDDMDLDDFDAIVDDFGEDDEGSLGFGIDPKEMEEDMKGMKEAIYGAGLSMGEEEEGDHDAEVEKLQAMMAKMQAVRELIVLESQA